MHKLVVAALVTALALPAHAARKAGTEEEKTLYAVGMIMARQLSVFNLTAAELEMVRQGFEDARNGKAELEVKEYREKTQELARARRKAQAERQAAANREFLERAARDEGARRSASGLIYHSLREGTGKRPGPTDAITVNFRGFFPDGKEFDSSASRGRPLEAKMAEVGPCLKEGLPKMQVGGKARLVCPPHLAYGEAGVADLIPPGATLVFEVELLEVKN